MSYRDDLDALGHRVHALEEEAAAAGRKLDEARRLLSEAAARRRLPVLDDLRVAAPCKADWAQMEGDERVRFCGQCQKHVYNLSGMTRVEAESLIVENEGAVCVRYYQRADGTVLTNDCPDGVRRRNRRRRIVAISFGAMSAVAGAVLMLTGRGVAPTMGAVRVAVPVPKDVPEPRPVAVMGEPAMVEPVVMGKIAAPSVMQGTVTATHPKKR